MDVIEKTVLISGGNSGLGLETARLLLKTGYKVIILGKDSQKLKQAQQDLDSPRLSTVVCDLRDYSQIFMAVKQIGPVDILINNAGIIAYSHLIDQNPKNISDIVNTNLLGTIYLTQAVLPSMFEKNTGTILNVSSTTGLPTGGSPDESVYAASKFGVSGFTEALKKEINTLQKNIRILGFFPGGMNTPLFSKSGLEKDTSAFMDPVEIAKIIVFILERPESIKMDHVVVNRNKNL